MTLTRPWSRFFDEKMRKIFEEKKTVMDIGGGLRAVPDRGNRVDPSRAWLLPFIEKVKYCIIDPVPDYKPDIVADIHALPFEDASQEAYICIAVLEHVENPALAVKEMHRTLAEGGYCFVYVPFLYYYHAERGYYADYWRFTEEAVRYLFKPFASLEIVRVRGALETWIRNSPLGRVQFFSDICFLLDQALGKSESHQTSGFYVFAVK